MAGCVFASGQGGTGVRRPEGPRFKVRGSKFKVRGAKSGVRESRVQGLKGSDELRVMSYR